MDPDQQSIKSLFFQYLELAWRRKLCILPFPVLLGLVVFYAFSLPPVYQSEGVLLVEDQNIPTELVRTTVTSYAAEQMQVIRQQIEATENVMQVIGKYGLYSNSVDADPRALAQRFRDSMLVETIDANILDPEAGRRRIISIAFKISFQDESPQLATKVASELVQLFLETNSLTRTKEAAQTSAFLRGESDELRVKVTALEDRLAEFKSENANSLPEVLEYNLEVIAGSEERLREIQVSIDNLTEQEQLLAIELRSMDPYTGLQTGVSATTSSGEQVGVTPALRLAQMKSQLAQLLNRYSESHPTVVALIGDISALEEQIALEPVVTEERTQEENDMLSPVYLELRYRVGSVERDIASLQQESVDLRQQISEYRERVERTYIVEREFDELQREYVATSTRYDQLRSAQYEAEVAQSLEEKNQVESLKVIEEPKVPRAPVGPERFKIIALGTGVAGFLCLGLGLVVELLDERIYGRRGLYMLTGEEALASIPSIRTESDDKQRSKNRRVALVLIVLLAILAAAAYTHFFVVNLLTLLN